MFRMNALVHQIHRNKIIECQFYVIFCKESKKKQQMRCFMMHREIIFVNTPQILRKSEQLFRKLKKPTAHLFEDFLCFFEFIIIFSFAW